MFTKGHMCVPVVNARHTCAARVTEGYSSCPVCVCVWGGGGGLCVRSLFWQYAQSQVKTKDIVMFSIEFEAIT